jgi:hypothetical protein
MSELCNDIKLQNWTLYEAAQQIRSQHCSFTDAESRKRLADCLEELERFRHTAYTIRCALATAEKQGVGR